MAFNQPWPLTHEEIIKDNFPDDPFTIYTFRQTYGTRRYEAGTELPVLAELMGRSNVQTTMIYVHASPQAEDRSHGEAAGSRRHAKPSSCRKGKRQKLRICHFEQVT